MNRTEACFWLNQPEFAEWKVLARAGKLVEAIKNLRNYSEQEPLVASLGLKDAKDIVVEYRDNSPTPKEDHVTTIELDHDCFGVRTVLQVTKMASGEGYKIEQINTRFLKTEADVFTEIALMCNAYANRFAGPRA